MHTYLRPSLSMPNLVLVFEVDHHLVFTRKFPRQHAAVGGGDLLRRGDVAHLLQHGTGRLFDAVDELDDELVRNPFVVLVQIHAIVEEDVSYNNNITTRVYDVTLHTS